MFWKVLRWGLIADWGSKMLINLLVEPIQLPRGPLSSLLGKVYPYPPGHFSIAHFEHWHEHWYDLDGVAKIAYNLIEKITPFEVPMVWFFLAVLLAVPLLISLSSIGRQNPQVRLSIGLGFYFAAGIGNKGEVWLFGHATDWIWIKFSSFSAFTNFADLMLLVALVTLSFGRKQKDAKVSPHSIQETGLSTMNPK